MVLSNPPDRRRLPSAEKVRESTCPECPLRQCSSLPVAASQRQIGPSRPPAARILPSGENASEWARKVKRLFSLPVAVSHSKIWPLSPAARVLPSVVRATAEPKRMALSPPKRRISLPSGSCHKRTALSEPPEASRLPSADSDS